MDFLLAQTGVSTETGATEFLANLSVGWVTAIALALTVLRVALLLPAFLPSSYNRPPQVSPVARSVAEILESLVVAGVLVFLIIRPFFVQAFFIPSESMEPTLLGHDAGVNRTTGEVHEETVHDHIFVNKLVFRMGDPQRGDIIVFKAPKNADAESRNSGRPQQENILIKRCVAIPGDTVEIKEGTLYINGKKVEEDIYEPGKQPVKSRYFIKEKMNESPPPQAIYGVGQPLKLEPGQYFAMGDNRNDSNDSRYWGPLERSRIIGKASVIFWPLNRIQILK
jgi:signal peptidase I